MTIRTYASPQSFKQVGRCRSEQVQTLTRPALLFFGPLQTLRTELRVRLLRIRGDLPEISQ